QRKWIHCFFEVKAIVFMVNLSRYDQMIFSDEMDEQVVSDAHVITISGHRPQVSSIDQNAIREAMREFKNICSHPTFSYSTIVRVVSTMQSFQDPLTIHNYRLIMNKLDLFTAKLTNSP
ncbi:hypothetical protein C8R43DRAFT_910500, partial [Mycena crocata]